MSLNKTCSVKRVILFSANIISLGWNLTHMHHHDICCNCYEGNPEKPKWLKRLNKWIDKQDKLMRV